MDLYYLLFDWLRDCFVFGKEKGNRVIINFKLQFFEGNLDFVPKSSSLRAKV